MQNRFVRDAVNWGLEYSNATRDQSHSKMLHPSFVTWILDTMITPRCNVHLISTTRSGSSLHLTAQRLGGCGWAQRSSTHGLPLGGTGTFDRLSPLHQRLALSSHARSCYFETSSTREALALYHCLCSCSQAQQTHLWSRKIVRCLNKTPVCAGVYDVLASRTLCYVCLCVSKLAIFTTVSSFAADDVYVFVTLPCYISPLLIFVWIYSMALGYHYVVFTSALSPFFSCRYCLPRCSLFPPTV